MASLVIKEFFDVQLTSREVALIVKALRDLKDASGEPVGDALALRETLLRQRARQCLERAEKASEVLRGLDEVDFSSTDS